MKTHDGVMDIAGCPPLYVVARVDFLNLVDVNRERVPASAFPTLPLERRMRIWIEDAFENAAEFSGAGDTEIEALESFVGWLAVN
jgi:hypothetical protein